MNAILYVGAMVIAALGGCLIQFANDPSQLALGVMFVLVAGLQLVVARLRQVTSVL